MTRTSILEYVEAVRGRYFGGLRKEKGKIMDEFTKVTGYHRKAAIRLIRQGNQASQDYEEQAPGYFPEHSRSSFPS